MTGGARLGHLVFVTPDPGNGLPTRPGMLVQVLAASGQFERVTIVRRLQPLPFAKLVRSGGSLRARWLLLESKIDLRSRVVSHPWPFGPLEERALGSIVRSTREPSVLWICDPKSARVLSSLPRTDNHARSVLVFDAYDAWDMSPLVRGERRRRAAVDGYRQAARGADLVFANTPAMAGRLRGLGARDVRLLPNGAPPISPATASPERAVAYVGRIHERFDTALVTAAADAHPDALIHLAGPIERMPLGWADLVARPNVRVEGALDAAAALALIGRSTALIVPHRPDDYTRSQDAMKAWDALSVGAPVISTSVPPAIDWEPPVAIVADTPAAFALAVGRALAGELDAGRGKRLAMAAENGWDRRAAVALEAIAEVTGV